MSNTSENLNVLCISRCIINKTATWLATLSAEDQKCTVASALKQVQKPVSIYGRSQLCLFSVMLVLSYASSKLC